MNRHACVSVHCLIPLSARIFIYRYLAFLFALDRELEKVESFFARKLNDLKKQREKYRYVQSHDHDSNSEALVALTETMNLIHNLLSFADTNKKGFAKILKK